MDVDKKGTSNQKIPKKNFNPLYQRLPRDVNGALEGQPEDFLKKMAFEDMPPSYAYSFSKEMRHIFLLMTSKNSKKKVHRVKKSISRSERADLNLLKLPTKGWSYSKLEQTRKMWLEYMRDNMDRVANIPKASAADWTSFSVTLAKVEIIGAEIKVVRSRVPSMVGIGGTVVLETKNSLQVVTKENKLKILLKEPSVFVFEVDNKRFTIFGKHLLTRPSERSVKKIKAYMNPDL